MSLKTFTGFLIGMFFGFLIFNLGARVALENSEVKIVQAVEPDESPTRAQSPLPTPTSTPKSTPTPKPTATSTPTPVPTPTPMPQPSFTEEQINGFIERFSSQYSIDPNELRHIALCESGLNPFAYNSGYAGLFQFGSTTWRGYRNGLNEDPNPELRFNAEEAVQTASYALSLGKRHIWPNCVPK